MCKTKKTILICIVCVVSAVAVKIGLYFLIDNLIPKTFSSAKRSCEKILNEYQVEMEQIAIDSLKQFGENSGKFREYSFNSYPDEGIVEFSIDAQGFLGGQYWYLIYSENKSLNGKADSYTYEEPYGNNVERAEKITQNWWFYWIDYDGTKRSYE